jgi:hypothetical protein
MSTIASNFSEKLPASSKKGKPIKGPGLTIPGVVLLQSALITLVAALEILIKSDSATGILTGLAILAAFAGGLYLGRPGTSYVSAVTPPIAFIVALILLVPTIGGTGAHVTLLGTAIVKSLAKEAPYLILGAAIGWGGHFARRKPAKSSNL